MTQRTDEVRLQDAIDIVRDLHRAHVKVEGDWDFRREDIKGAWAEETGLWRLRAAALTPLSLAEHGVNRLLNRSAALALKPVLARVLRDLVGTADAESYGLDLARSVADALIAGLRPTGPNQRHSTLAYFHRDYCGMGLECGEEAGKHVFRYGAVNDGGLYPPYLLQFDTADALVEWLAQQSDLSLSGVVGDPPFRDWVNAGNQRLNRARLVDFVAG